MLLSGWRSRLLLREVKLTDPTAAADERREACVRQFALLFRDIPFFVLFTVLVATLYRAPNVLLKLLATQKRLLASSPRLLLESADASSDDKGCLKLIFKGRKPAELQAEQVRLAVGGGTFWKALEATFGGVVNVGRSMLPAKLVPKYMEAGCVAHGESATTLTITSPPGAVKQLQKLAAGADPVFTIQGQVCTPPQVLFELHTKASELVRAPGSLSLDLTKPEADPDLPIQDVFYGVVG